MSFPVLASMTAAAELAMTGQMIVPNLEPKAMGGFTTGYDGANYSSRRGYVYFPTLNTKRELLPPTRTEMSRRARYLVRNVGYAKRCTHGLANMVGYLSPRALTDDRDWNRRAEKALERQCGLGQGLNFDRSGRFNIYAAQPKLTASRLTDGDVGIALTNSPTDGAMVAFYEAHQIGNGIGSMDANWRDGVRVVNDRAEAFRLLDPENRDRNVDVPAANFILHADYLSFGHSRGVTPLSHAITNMLDVVEIRSDVKSAIKLAGKAGYYIGKQMMTQASGAPRGMGNPKTTGTTDRGEPIVIENVFRGGQMRELNPGEEIKELLDTRPHPNNREFIEDLNRDIAYGVGISSDVLWNIAKLGGASVRYVLADAQVWIEAQQQLLVDQFLHRFWVYFIAKEIKAKRLRECNDPEWYFKVGFQPQAKITVDVGRDGKLSIDLHQAGMLSLKRWYGAQGLDSEDELRDFVREYALKVKLVEEVSKEMGVELDFNKVFPPAPGSSNILTPDMPGFNAPDDVQQMIVEIHEGMAHLRAA